MPHSTRIVVIGLIIVHIIIILAVLSGCGGSMTSNQPPLEGIYQVGMTQFDISEDSNTVPIIEPGYEFSTYIDAIQAPKSRGGIDNGTVEYHWLKDGQTFEPKVTMTGNGPVYTIGERDSWAYMESRFMVVAIFNIAGTKYIARRAFLVIPGRG